MRPEEEFKKMADVFLKPIKPGQTSFFSGYRVDAQMDRMDQNSVWELAYYTRATGLKVVREKEIFLKKK